MYHTVGYSGTFYELPRGSRRVVSRSRSFGNRKSNRGMAFDRDATYTVVTRSE